MYAEFLIILDERNRLVDLSNQLKADILQLQGRLRYFSEVKTSTMESDQVSDEIHSQDITKSLWTNPMRVLPSKTTLPPRSTDRVTESQRKVRRKMQQELTKKHAVSSGSREKINIRNWNKKED